MTSSCRIIERVRAQLTSFMSSICTLGISGFRSYSNQRQEVIHFDKPVTLILGKNGSGKTTIIECLRAVTSGSLPPGTNAGRSFLLDPELIGQTEVTGVLKLKFIAANRIPILCIRTMNFRKRGDKYEFKKLEQIIKSKDFEGKEVTVNCNVNEIDRQVPELLGVSRAILENVLFCHQEDSLWPFKEGATLKAIFDDLFETTKFTKVSEVTKNQIKEGKKKMKDDKHKSEMSRQRYDVSLSNVKKLQVLHKEHRENKIEIKKLESKRNQLEKTISPTQRIEELLTMAISTKRLKEYQRGEKKKEINRIKGECKIDSEESVGEILETELDKELEILQKEMGEVSQEIKVKIERCEDISKQMQELKKLIGTEDIETQISTSSKRCEELCRLLNVGQSSTIKETVDYCRLIMDRLKNEVEVIEEEISDIKTSRREKSDRLAHLLEQKSRIELTSKKRQLVSRRSLRAIDQDIDIVKGMMDELKENHARKMEEIRNANQKRERWIRGRKVVEKRKAEERLDQVEEQKKKLVSECGLNFEDKIDLFLLENKLIEIQNEIKDKEEEIKRLTYKEVEVQYLNAQRIRDRNEVMESLVAVQKRLSKSLGKETVNGVSGETIEQMKEKVRKLEIDIAVVIAIRKEGLVSYVELSHRDSQCYLCLKKFETEDYERRFKFFKGWNENGDPIVVGLRRKLEEHKSNLSLLQENKASVDEYDNLRDRMAKIDQETKKADIQYGELRYSINQVQNYIRVIESRKAAILEFQLLITKIDNERERISSEFSPNEDADFSTEELERISSEKEFPMPEDSEKDEEMNNKMESMNLEVRLSKLREEKAINSLEDSEEPLAHISDQDIETSEIQLAEIEAQYSEKMEYLNRMKNNMIRCEMLISDLQRYILLDHSNENIQQLKLLQSTLGIIQTEISHQQSNFKMTTSRFEHLEKMKELRTQLKEEDELRVQIERQGEVILDLKKQNEVEKLNRQLLEETSKSLSRLTGIEETQQKQVKQLYEAVYQDKEVEKEYFASLTDFEFLRQYVVDLEFYNDSLDKALSNYHQEQVQKINRMIENLWKRTYKNEDIRKIEIKADQIIEKNSSSKSNFNYRVVFFGKDNTELEMRGRSSMGQKVLASIIIRIALAQAFGINCGVLALDEPTTNLDRANIISLAQFLADLIDQQKENESFQLIIITHDDDFIKMFRHYTGNYYHIYKDLQGFSKIEKRDIEKY